MYNPPREGRWNFEFLKDAQGKAVKGRIVNAGAGRIGGGPALPLGRYSNLNVSAGLAEAALTDWAPTVRRATARVANPVPANPAQPMPVL